MRLLICAASVLALLATFAHATDDIVIADFEGGSYGDWTVEGQAFGERPAPGTLPGQMPVDGFQGKGLVNSFAGGDGTTGLLTSPSFQIERKYINFLVGGGKHPGVTCIDLLVDGQPVRTATGPNAAPGGTERLDWASWDVSDLKGKTAVIRIVDNSTEGWGHINVDQITQSDKKPPIPVEIARNVVLNGSFLNFPVKTGAEKRLLAVEIEGGPTRQFEIELALDAPQFWTFMDVSEFKGKKAVIRGKNMPEGSKALETIDISDAIKEAETFYRESLRPQFHFTSRRGWNNDPNGLVYHDGEYHLFYQHNPYGWAWGNMHWGHAVSTDLVHWRELPEALYPDEMGTMFSGSAIVDTENSLGLNRDKQQALALFYTAAGGVSPESQGQPFTQCMAYSLDRGRTITKFEGNPVLPNIVDGNRDPKVIRHEPSGKWLMALYLKDSDFGLFASTDLKKWDLLCGVTIPGTSECPEFFEIPVQGKGGETRWIFYGGNGRYVIGYFDGKTFSPESGPHELHYGNCFYASQTYNNTPDGRRIVVGWGQAEFPGMPFNQQMTFPAGLTLRETPEGLRLFTLPVHEVESLYAESRKVEARPLTAGVNGFEGITVDFADLEADIALGTSDGFTFKVGEFTVAYSVSKGELSSVDKKAPLSPVDGHIRLRVLIDRGSVEIFANDGRVYMPMGNVRGAAAPLSLTSEGATLESATIHELKSIWPEPSDR